MNERGDREVWAELFCLPGSLYLFFLPSSLPPSLPPSLSFFLSFFPYYPFSSIFENYPHCVWFPLSVRLTHFSVPLCLSVCLSLSTNSSLLFLCLFLHLRLSHSWYFPVVSVLFHPLPIFVILDFYLTLLSFLIIVFHCNIDFDLFLLITLD